MNPGNPPPSFDFGPLGAIVLALAAWGILLGAAMATHAWLSPPEAAECHRA